MAGWDLGKSGPSVTQPSSTGGTGWDFPGKGDLIADATNRIGSSSSGASGAGAGSSGGSPVAASLEGRSDKPRPLTRWYATVESIAGGAATVVLDDDSDGASTITVAIESATPTEDDRVIVDFREDGLAVVSAVVA
jgi:hypothetical protein